MHIARDSLVVVSEGEPFAGSFGKVESIKIYYEQGLAPRVLVFVYLLISGHTVPFQPEQIQLRSNNENELLQFMRLQEEQMPVAA